MCHSIIVGLLVFCVHSAEPLSLKQCVETALVKDAQVQAAQAALLRAEAAMAVSRAAFMPRAQLKVAYHGLSEPMAFENFTLQSNGQAMQVDQFVMSDDQMLRAEASVEVPLWTGGRRRAMREMTQSGVEGARARSEQQRHRLITQVIVAHAQVMLAREARRYLNDTIAEMKLFSLTAQRDFEAGARNAPEKDVLQIQYDLHDMETWLKELDKWETLGLEALKVARDLPASETLSLAGERLDVLSLGPDGPQSRRQALEANPEIKALTSALSGAQWQERWANSSRMPTLGLFAQHTYIQDDFDPNLEQWTAYGLAMGIDLFDGGMSRAKRREAQMMQQSLEHQITAAKRQVDLGCQQALLEIEQFQQQLSLRAKAREVAMRQIEVVHQGYQYGLATVGDVNDAQVQKRWSDANWLFKKLDLVKAMAQLNELVGNRVLPLY
jgi:outer membrane protein TolC